jgi:hypothetical protein
VALQVEREVGTLRAHLAQHAQEGRHTARPIEDQDIVEGRMMQQEGRGSRLNYPHDARGRVAAPQAHQQGQRPGHVADGSEQRNQDAACRDA